MSVKKLRIAVIGTGLIGSLHAEIYNENNLAELVAVCDINKKAVKQVAKKNNCNYYFNYEEMLKNEALDAVSIATPESIRLKPCIMAAKKGLKILLEKPLGKKFNEIKNLVTRLKKIKAYVAVNFILHADPRFRKMKEEIKNNKIGNIVTYFARRRGNRLGIEYYAPWTDLLSSTLIHDIQMILELSKSNPERVFAEAVIRECKKYNSHDAVVATLKFRDGSVASFETSWVLPKNQPEPLDPAFNVIGDQGSIIIEGSSLGMNILTNKQFIKPDLAHWPTIDSSVDGALKKNLDMFVNNALNNKPPIVDLHSAQLAEKVVHSMKESIRLKKPIKL
ncbi:MAG: scyllo-inositol 2-dehydrogenase (NAD(+)) [Alphaproteobacteria bacterium MarineAlpha5_Bin6]|nr:MAG: scyllo-inositol 2-dehydrogenase (NAD(+)) [Alphaproteobacteria bacterium MarineAlpha5_Bin7]PPR54893.1 MAG: scyllo-inositol 2-dehydrogenase (NAD(+)) [Alphaproteobacteria bacterium MarineAlpha5_Bin6]|tara:strand:+ start:263 stop:1267 length:1005 start_codon:yes stop_codon:yes gene_type:complete